MTEYILLTLALVSFFGILSQWLSWYIKLPSIIFLLLFGIVIGPVAGLFDPDTVLGELLFPFVSMGVAVILFEGGLTLRFHEIKGLTRPLYMLLTLGLLVTWTIVALATHLLVGLSWELSILFGALMTVTGPTVIKPLLKTVRPHADIANFLHWEGVILDVAVAILIVLVYKTITLQHSGAMIPLSLASIIATGIINGTAGAFLLSFLLRRYFLPHFLHHVFTLTLVLVIFALSNAIAHESGLLAVTLMGMILSNIKSVDIEEILFFKESLSLLLISVLFIILSARLDLSALLEIGWSALGLLGIILFVARPLSVMVSTLFSDLTLRARIFLSWIAPRGIIAAAVSALFAIRLEEFGYTEAKLLVPLTFMVIIGTILLQGLSARPLAKWLNLQEAEPEGMLILGANRVSREIARSLKAQGFTVKLADTDWENVNHARMEGFDTYYGRVISDHADRNMELAGIGGLLAISPHATLNALASVRFKSEFGVENIYYLQNAEGKKLEKSKASHSTIVGRQLFTEDVTFTKLSSLLHGDGEIKTTTLSEKFDIEAYKKAHESKVIPLYLIDTDGKLHFFTTDHELKPKEGWKITSLIYKRKENNEKRDTQ
ncbi:cation:proton antiporter [Sulfurovum sp. XGS-02]|uniref:cation:proton antiporter n=1 Tax=Sulfurovum sp. XGS-02 TaxID=2925411 RepID=UPI00205C1DE6|nr:sodium:proton antiporter [Sulfurovum sp. XGS-02]UPT78525.1 cation:proton antiporter [Sulfurovum sp. XGS-02]